MIYEVSIWAVLIFIFFVAAVLGLSFYFARKTKSASSYYAAGGTIHWGVNGIAFAGDYLSAASFLGICGMIAFSGFDGFLYSIGYLAGWVAALFLVAEPLKRLGKYTFTDALDARFNAKSIKLTASISTLVVSLFYLIPQMVGAGDLVVPLLGLPHWVGVLIVGSIVIFIVATAGMTSTTYVQFIKGALLIIFSTVLTFYILNHGLTLKPGGNAPELMRLTAIVEDGKLTGVDDEKWHFDGAFEAGGKTFARLESEGVQRWFLLDASGKLVETLSLTITEDGIKLYNGAPRSEQKFYQVGNVTKIVRDGEELDETGPLGPFGFFAALDEAEITRYSKVEIRDAHTTVWYPKPTAGRDMINPGLLLKVSNKHGANFWTKLNFVSLMLALFLGTSALPHILIRYYTVPSQRDARKSTIVAIVAIGFFYILTMYMGLGAAINGVLDVESSNMAGPLLAKYFGVGLFSIISAIAFATVLGTVAGLIVASSGAIAHDFLDNYLGMKMDDRKKVMAGKMAAFGVGVFAIVLGILFKGMNVSFLVGLAFSVAASANFPAIVFLLFWEKTTAKGIAASILTGILSSVILILLSPSMYERYGLPTTSAPFPMDNPGIVSIPLAVIVLVVVSLLTQKDNAQKVENYHHA
ncbi:MAG: cation acetate symporter [Bacteroidia bacterium]|jgi:cation/acetate symporter|nr:cation acetate symporter [Bacteroidia bacterium]